MDRSSGDRRVSEVRISLPEWIEEFVDWNRRYADDDAKMGLAIELARQNVLRDTGGPFGSVIFACETGLPLAVGTNSVVRLNNSTLHAEMVAFMMAQARVGTYTLSADGLGAHELFTSCEPCAMCLGGVLWSGVTRLVYAAARDDARRLSFDEGPVFPESYAYLRERGIDVKGEVRRADANDVFAAYLARGGEIYNG
jgi:tRNA(Arg) A34 adenosine deaminase TadA